MNVFYLDENPQKAASYHCDKHVVKMIVEYAQLLSTTHRILDGDLYYDKTKNGSKIKRWKLENETKENVIYKASHINHPSAVWVRESIENYFQMYKLYMATLAEYTNRYGKVHGSSKPSMLLLRPPKNIPMVKGTQLPQCMPDMCKVKDNPILAYRNYYIVEKNSFASWKNREIPEWFQTKDIMNTWAGG